MKDKPIVGIDLDDVCWEFVRPLLEEYNLKYNDNVDYEDITDWNIHKFLKPECKNIFKEFATEEFFEKLRIPPSIAGWLAALNGIADIKFVTAASSRTIPWRYKLLKRELDFFKDDMLVKLTDKKLMSCSYFIDDNSENCKAVENFDMALTLQIARPWNGNAGFDTDEALAKIVIDILRGRDV